jgi:hypothetical protein
LTSQSARNLGYLPAIATAGQRDPGLTATGGRSGSRKIVRIGTGLVRTGRIGHPKGIGGTVLLPIAEVGRRGTGATDHKPTGEIGRRTIGPIDPRPIGETVLKATAATSPKVIGAVVPRATGEIARKEIGRADPRLTGAIAQRAIDQIDPRPTGAIDRREIGASGRRTPDGRPRIASAVHGKRVENPGDRNHTVIRSPRAAPSRSAVVGPVGHDVPRGRAARANVATTSRP